MAKVALCIIATNDYYNYIEPLKASADRYFLNGHNVVYHYFTNKELDPLFERECLHYVKHEPWPAMTLNRYHIMTSVDLSAYDYVFYIDADMLFVAPVGDEVLNNLTGVLHPGYYRGGGAWENNKLSTAYVEPKHRRNYLAGGFQGGAWYYNYCKVLASAIDLDRDQGITATWHDESHWNRVYATHQQAFTLLSPAYCMVQEKEKRRMWGIDNIEPKIIALAKDHKTIRK